MSSRPQTPAKFTRCPCAIWGRFQRGPWWSRTWRVALCGLAVSMGKAGDDAFDRVEQALTFSDPSGDARLRLSGTMDLEAYATQLVAPGVIDATREELWNPRLSVFLDAQFGPRTYLFVQARADRGFDPGHRRRQVRLDEYALRFTSKGDAPVALQLGKFATIVGNWATRHTSWGNPFINAPLPYEYLTGVWDSKAIDTSGLLLLWSHVRPGLRPAVEKVEKTLRIPIVWGPSYTTGASIAGEAGVFNYAAEVKLGSLSSRPESWQHAREQRHHPTTSWRFGYRPSATWNFGVSASSGAYLREFADESLPRGTTRGDYQQRVLAADAAFAWRHWQLWSEVYWSRFEIPLVGDADTTAYYVEGKYKITPRLSAALRWGQQFFGTIPHRFGSVRWGYEVWQVEAAPAFRFTAHTQLKLQYTLKHGDSGNRSTTRALAAQFTLRF